jgi:hypothetical protein
MGVSPGRQSYGVYRTPWEWVQACKTVRHPFDDSALAPVTQEVIAHVLTQEEGFECA